jgi:uncharacterized iron-regulated membrane protein
MPNLDEYYHLLRSQPPALDADALRASIRAAVGRVHTEMPTEAMSETMAETMTEVASNPLLMETASVSMEAGSNLTNTLLSSSIAPVFGSVLSPLLAVLTVTALLVVGFVVWRGQNDTTKEALRPESAQQATERVLGAQTAEGQDRLEEVSGTEETSALQGNVRLSKDSLDKFTRSFQNDNTEELYPNIPDLAQTQYSEQAPHFDVEMNEQERHLDSITARSFRAAPKRDAAHQRQYDLLMQLVHRAQDHAPATKAQARGGVPCSLPAALRGESSVDCILMMLEQQALLLNSNELVYLTQQARREKNSATLNVLEAYIREHF